MQCKTADFLYELAWPHRSPAMMSCVQDQRDPEWLPANECRAGAGGHVKHR
jgi:hypothetical protein